MADNLKIQAIPARQCQRDVDVGFNDGSLTAVINVLKDIYTIKLQLRIRPCRRVYGLDTFGYPHMVFWRFFG